MIYTEKPWEILPLDGKYYGTKVKIGNQTITIWGNRAWVLSDRERDRRGPFDSEWTETECMSDGHYEDEKDYQIAKLIAAAPEMLEVLQKLLKEKKSNVGINWDMAENIIDKAIGKKDKEMNNYKGFHICHVKSMPFHILPEACAWDPMTGKATNYHWLFWFYQPQEVEG